MTNRDHYPVGSMRMSGQDYEGAPGVPPRPPQVHPGVVPGPRAMPQQGVPGLSPQVQHPQAAGRGPAAAATAAGAAAGAARVPSATPGPRPRPVHETCDLRGQFLTPEDLRDSFTQYKVFRFEKMVDEDRHDADGKLREESTWLYARRTLVCDREQKDIFREICDLNMHSDETFAQKRKALSNEQMSQVENTLAELQQAEHDPAHFEITLVQLDDKLRPLTDEECREYYRRRGRKVETYRAAGNGAQAKRKKKKKRVSITAYYKRSPKPGVGIEHLIKDREQGEWLAQAPLVVETPLTRHQQPRPQGEVHGYPAAAAAAAAAPAVPPPQPRPPYNGQAEGYAAAQENPAPRAHPIPQPHMGPQGHTSPPPQVPTRHQGPPLPPGYLGHQGAHRQGHPPPHPANVRQPPHPANVQQGAAGGGANAAPVYGGGGVRNPPHPPPQPQRVQHGPTVVNGAAPQAAHGGGGGGDNRARSMSRGPPAHDRQQQHHYQHQHQHQHQHHQQRQDQRPAQSDDFSSSRGSSEDCSSDGSESSDEDQSTACTSDDQASLVTSDLPRRDVKYHHRRREAARSERHRRLSVHSRHAEDRPYHGKHGRRRSTGGQAAGGPHASYPHMQQQQPPPLVVNLQQPPPQQPFVQQPPTQQPFVPQQQPVQQPFVHQPVAPHPHVQQTFVPVPITVAPTPTAVDPPAASYELHDAEVRDAFDIYNKGVADGRRLGAFETVHVTNPAPRQQQQQQPRNYHHYYHHSRYQPSLAATTPPPPPPPLDTGARYVDVAEMQGSKRQMDRIEQMMKNIEMDARGRGRDRDSDRHRDRDREYSEERLYRDGPPRYHSRNRHSYDGGAGLRHGGGVEQDRGEDVRRYREMRRNGEADDRERERYGRRSPSHERPWPPGPNRRDGFMHSVGRDSWPEYGGGSGYPPSARRRGERGYYPWPVG